MTELAENPQDSFDPRLDAAVFGAVNLGGDTDSTAATLAAMAVFASGGALRLPGDHCLVSIRIVVNGCDFLRRSCRARTARVMVASCRRARRCLASLNTCTQLILPDRVTQ